MDSYKGLSIVPIMVTLHSGETDSLEVVVKVTKYTPFLASYITKSLGTWLKFISDGIMIAELKALCHYYFHINVIIQQK